MKRSLKAAALGGVIGLALNQIISYIVSLALRLGYFMAYPASLPERVGGEMNAVMCQMMFFILLGMGAGLFINIIQRVRVKGGARLLLIVFIAIATAMPSAMLAFYMLH